MALKLGLLGCGGMGHRHIRGLHLLQSVGRLRFELAAVCDFVPAAASRAADLAEELLGQCPRMFGSFAEARAGLPQLDAIIITTGPDMHAAVAVEALGAGVHVLVEKPIALTVQQGIAMIAANTHDCVLAVAENYRRDPINRLAKALLDAGAIGRPFMALQASSSGGDQIIITPWRHLRRTGGIVIDMGVHYTDLLEYYLGPIDSVIGMSATVEPQRRDAQDTWHQVDAEDVSLGVARFHNGALAHWMLSLAGRGESMFSRVIYGTGGSLAIPPDRSGKPLQLVQQRNGESLTLSDEALLDLVPDFQLDPTTAALFGGERLARYDLPWANVDAGLLAIEQDDFADAILAGHPPEVSGGDGLRSLALVYGFLEAERLGRPVTTAELISGEAHRYQDALAEVS